MVCLYYMHKQLYSHVSFFFVIFLRHCVMSQLHYQCFCQDNTINDIFGYVQVTHKRTVVITLFLGFCHTLYYVTTKFFQLPKKLILNNIRNALFTLRSNYFRKYNTITLCIGSSFLDFIFELHCDILLLRHNYVTDLFKGVLF